MLRSAGKFVGTAAGVAASGPASQSQCRAQQSRLPKQHSKVRFFVAAALRYFINKSWLLVFTQLEVYARGLSRVATSAAKILLWKASQNKDAYQAEDVNVYRGLTRPILRFNKT